MQAFHSNILDPIDPASVGIGAGLHPHEPFAVNSSHDNAPGDPTHAAIEAGRDGGGIGGEKPGHPPMPVHTPLGGKYAKPTIPTTEEEPKEPSRAGGVVSQADVEESDQEAEDHANTLARANKYSHTVDNQMEASGQGRMFGTAPTPADEAEIEKNKELNTPQNIELRKSGMAPGGRDRY